jgi:hypothetical protein
VVTLARLVVVAQHAGIADDQCEPILAVVQASCERGWKLPDDDVREAPFAQHRRRLEQEYGGHEQEIGAPAGPCQRRLGARPFRVEVLSQLRKQDVPAALRSIPSRAAQQPTAFERDQKPCHGWRITSACGSTHISPMIDAREQKVADKLGIETYGDSLDVESL